MSQVLTQKIKDRLAILLSALCVVQCLMLPAMVTVVPVLDIWWLSDSIMHPVLLTIVTPLTFYTLMPARERHGSNVPLQLALPGLMMLFAGVFMEQTLMEKTLTVIGASLLAAAHLKNIFLNREIKLSQQQA